MNLGLVKIVCKLKFPSVVYVFSWILTWIESHLSYFTCQRLKSLPTPIIPFFCFNSIIFCTSRSFYLFEPHLFICDVRGHTKQENSKNLQTRIWFQDSFFFPVNNFIIYIAWLAVALAYCPGNATEIFLPFWVTFWMFWTSWCLTMLLPWCLTHDHLATR